MVLSESNLAIARQIQGGLPDSPIYGLKKRCHSADQTYDQFGEFVSQLFCQGHGIIGICATGILIRTLAPLLTNKRLEPPVLAIALNGSAVVPLLGGLNGANNLAHQIAETLGIKAAITTAGELQFKTTLLSPPPRWRLVNTDDQAKTFLSDVLNGAKVQIIGHAPWLDAIPQVAGSEHTIEIVPDNGRLPQANPSAKYLIYEAPVGSLAVVGIGPGKRQWRSPEVRQILDNATDFVGYVTYLNLISEFTKNRRVHSSDNRVEAERAELALDLAASGRSVAVVSSGDAGIYGMATAVLEVLDKINKPEWQNIELQIAPGISAMQAAAAAVGAPLGHDFCGISLSDILKPWSVLAQRIAAAAAADFVIAFYNPVSRSRTWQLDEAKKILLQWRSPDTPVVLAKNLGRTGADVQVMSLKELTPDLADMRTIILIGSSKTKTFRHNGQTRVYTPRNYK